MNLVKEAGKNILKISKTEWDTITVEAKKKGKKVNPWAICHSKIDKKKNPEKFERCVMDIKAKQPIKKD